MTYELLSKCFYKVPKKQYENECVIRKKSVSAVTLPVCINGNESFYVCTNEMILTLEEIYRKNLELTEKVNKLPEVDKTFCFKKCLIDEVNFTNDIEGIFSSRKELDEIYENIHSEASINKFTGLVDKYKLLIDSEKTIQLKTCEDIRQLYDEIILPEIASKDNPDGKLFRKGRVAVSNGIKDIHTGVVGESNIIDGMNSVLYLMYDSKISAVIRTAVCHYFIEYIHPFYNGNGRLGRFISSYMLRQELNPLLSYRLSYIINQNKQQYYKAFEICNDTRNFGDVTYFILMFCELISKSLDNLLSVIDFSIDRINYYLHQTKEIFGDNERNENNICFMLIQNSLFENIGLNINSIAYYSDLSISTVRNTIKKLKNNLNVKYTVIETYKQSHTNVYSVNIEALDNYLNDLK